MTSTGLVPRAAVLAAALFMGVALAACEEQGTMEQTGGAVDDAVTNTAEGVNQGGQQIEQSADQAQENTQ